MEAPAKIEVSTKALAQERCLRLHIYSLEFRKADAKIGDIEAKRELDKSDN